MSTLEVSHRTTQVNKVVTEYVPGVSPYREYVFNGAFGGGKVLAHGLDGAGCVRGIVYAPGPLADIKIAEILAEDALIAGVKEICRVRFSPFNLVEAACSK